MKEMIDKIVQEALKYAFDKYNYEIKVKNLDEMLEKIVPLSEKILYEENFDDVISSFVFAFFIQLSHRNKVYFIELAFSPHDDSYDFGLSSDEELVENLLLIRVTLAKYNKYKSISRNEHEAKTKELVEILEQHGFTKDQDEDEHFIYYNFSLPLDVEVLRFFI